MTPITTEFSQIEIMCLLNLVVRLSTIDMRKALVRRADQTYPVATTYG